MKQLGNVSNLIFFHSFEEKTSLGQYLTTLRLHRLHVNKMSGFVVKKTEKNMNLLKTTYIYVEKVLNGTPLIKIPHTGDKASLNRCG